MRLLTDLLALLLPGIQKDYPHRRVAFAIAALEEPRTSFEDGKGMRLTGRFSTRVLVLPRSAASQPEAALQRHHSGSIEVAHLHTNVSLLAAVSFASAQVSDMQFDYSVVTSEYDIVPERWSSTAVFAIQQVQRNLGLQGLYKVFAPRDVQDTVQLRNAECTYLDGWYGVIADVHVNAERFEKDAR